MPQVGRPPKPIEQKRRLGNPGKRPLPAAGSLALVPADSDAIDDLGPLGRALIEAGAGAWLSKADQAALIPLLEKTWDEYETLRARWIASDFSNETVMKRLGKVEDVLTRCLSLAGLTPVDRSRLGVAEVKARSKLEELMERRARATASTSGTSSRPSSASPRATTRGST